MKLNSLLLIASVYSFSIDDLPLKFKLFVQASAASCCYDIIDLQSFDCGELCSLPGVKLDFAINSNETEAAGYVAILPSLKSIIVAFRAAVTITNFINGPIVLPSTPDVINIGAFIGAKVHAGFEKNYMSIRDAMQQSVQKLAAQEQYNSYDIVFVGHSLGGTAANMAAVDFSFQTNKKYDSRVSLYTYGQPRVGNQEWADLFSTLSFNSRYYRLIQEFDPFPQFPSTILGFRHNGIPIGIGEDNVTFACPMDDSTNGESAVCSSPLRRALLKGEESHSVKKSYYKAGNLTCREDL
jgi:hypothetical protein